MSKKKSSSAEKKKKDITGIILISISAILLFALITQGKKTYVGEAGSVVAGFFIGFLGYICYLIPGIMIWWASIEFRHKKFPFKHSMIWGSIVLIVGASIFSHLVYQGSSGTFGDFLTDVIVRKAFGTAGSYIISIALIATSIVLITDISIKKMINFIYIKLSMVKTVKNKVKTVFNKRKKERQVKPKKTKKVRKKDTAPKIKKKEKKKPVIVSKEKKETEKTKKTKEKEDIKGYKIPYNLLKEQKNREDITEMEEDRGKKLVKVLNNFDIEAEISGIRAGPSITRYEISLPPGIKLSRIKNLSSNIAMALEAKTIRLLTPIPGMSAVGVEVPSIKQEIVYIKSLIESDEFKQKDTQVPYCLGKSVNGDFKIVDLTQMPHLLLAGATGSGKSVAIHVLINSVLFKSSPDKVRFILMDPKRVELPVYNGIPHLACEVITDPKKAIKMLNAVTREMDCRYDTLANSNVSDIDAYNKKTKANDTKIMPRLVVIIDELADLMAMEKNKVENSIIRIAQMARAVGIHLVLATQRPSVNVITGIIKANLPARVAFNVLSGVDSRTILDTYGAEKLLGKGDMLYQSAELPQAERIQGSFISRREIEKVVDYLKNTDYTPESEIDIKEKTERAGGNQEYEDDLYPKAVELVIKRKKASISLIQRKLRIGYNRAARIVDTMEENGIIGEDRGAKGRRVLVESEYLNNL
ncbi:MAG: DNA translocase FtsK 4TM domain-containing protein [Elusimicrobiota bacterium]